MNILTIIGSRPEAIKLAPVLKLLDSDADFSSFLCTTGQHRQMLDQVLEIFDLTPDIDLKVMSKNQTLAQLSIRIMDRIEHAFEKFNPEWVIVQGDTTSAMIGALAAFYRQIKVAHVEAGLRSHDKLQPFPEEINRKIISTIAELNFAPTEQSKANLIREGCSPTNVVVTGNTVVDASHLILDCKMSPDSQHRLDQLTAPLDNGVTPKIILVTAHRRENFGQPIIDICHALKAIAEKYGDSVRFIYPVHLNPNIQAPVVDLLSEISNIYLIEPLDYQLLINLISISHLILTDSGGIQEEAPGLNTPVLVLRNVTERPEGVKAGAVRLVGTDYQEIVTQACQLLDDSSQYNSMKNTRSPYGDGTAAKQIISSLRGYL